MDSFLWPLGTALWVGILTSASPCPLATNITALSFLSRDVRTPGRAFTGSLAYIMGRSLAYIAIAWILAIGFASMSKLSFLLQAQVNHLLAPLLIVIGVMLAFEFFPNITGLTLSQNMGERLKRLGILGAFVLGALFALAFCPISAALFFGTLIPLSVTHASPIALPTAYGLGTGLPVLAIAVTLSYGVNRIGLWVNRVGLFEKVARRVTGVVFVIAGGVLIWIE